MISFTPIELMAAISFLALICLTAVVIAFSFGRDSVNIELEIARKNKAAYTGGFRSPPPPPPPRKH